MTKKRKISVAVFASLTIFMTAFIFGNSLQIAEQSAATSGRFVSVLNAVLDFFGIESETDTLSFIVRKTAHFLGYFVLGTFSSLFVLSLSNKNILLVSSPLYCFIIALADEFIMQAMTEGRSPEWRDVFIDIGGAVLSVVIIFVTIKLIKRNRR
jgi:VanZ family protein